MSFLQNYPNHSIKNPVGLMYYYRYNIDELLTGSGSVVDIFHTQKLEAGIYSFRCNYVVKNTSATSADLFLIDFSIANNSANTMSQSQFGEVLGLNESMTAPLNAIFSVDSSSYGNPVQFAVEITYSGPTTLTRTTYSIQLCRIA